LEVKHMAGAKAQSKMSVLPGTVEMVTCFIMAPMPHPFAIGVYVRSVRMSVVIPKVALLSRMILLVCRG
jgi:hypothetical protein